MRVRIAQQPLVAAALLTLTLAGTGCAADVSTDDIENCSPSYTISNKRLGEISVQQEGRNKAIAWGFTPKERYRDAYFKLKVYAGGHNVDGKNQHYAPHGSIEERRAKKYSGKVFQIKGTAEKDGDTVTYDIRCYIA